MENDMVRIITINFFSTEINTKHKGFQIILLNYKENA